MATVELRNLEKVYANGTVAVGNLNLEIADSELVVLVGPSGCGKSTTLRMIAGLEVPTSGEVLIDDRLMNPVAPGERDIAMVFQNYALYPHMSVYENLAFGLKMRHLSQQVISSRVQEAARILSIESLLDRRPRELSGGQRQRVALGRAIVREPKVFLFDEPLSNLDATLRVQMRAEIAQLHRRLGTTVIYVTHDQVEAMTLGDRIVLMNHGLVQQVATPIEIYRRPANRFAASFIGSPAMNFFDGRIEEGYFTFSPPQQHTAITPLQLRTPIPDGPAVLGVRPEDFIVEGDGLPFGRVSLVMLEHLGHETHVHFECSAADHVARLPATADLCSGQQLDLQIRPASLHLFSAGDGTRLN